MNYLQNTQTVNVIKHSEVITAAWSIATVKYNIVLVLYVSHIKSTKSENMTNTFTIHSLLRDLILTYLVDRCNCSQSFITHKNYRNLSNSCVVFVHFFQLNKPVI